MAEAEVEETTPRRGCARRALRWALWLGVAGLIFAAVGAGVGGWAYREHVVLHPGPHLEPGHIRSIIAQESPVYYRDGTTRVGVFFVDEHRQYVPFEDLPLAYVMGIVAAEDKRYWSHRGVDPWGISRAMLKNFEAGTVVAGGSSLTQQTAKNLYYRPDRSVRSKWNEGVNALRLERHYSKAEILEFYVNQFHVSGNGRGLGIAARYFLDKDVSELEVVESAFLAGAVKGPANYDPFIGDEARRERSRERALTRTTYVLERLVAEEAEVLVGPRPRTEEESAAWAEAVLEARRIQGEAARALEEGVEIPFKRGTFRYDSSAVLDEVGRRLAEPPFAEVLAEAGIEDPATAGLVVVTTLDPDAQRESIYALWHHLTEVGTMLEGLSAQDFVLEEGRPYYDPYAEPPVHSFRVARVTAHVDQGGKAELDLDLGGHACRVDRDALVRASVAIRRGETRDRHAKTTTAGVDALAAALADGSLVLASVRDRSDSGALRCDLEVRPELQGAAVALEDGQLRAMVGGNDNRNFNRATALRQMGSTWKPLVYHAALQLGWSPDDVLDNRRNVFPWSTTWYWPRPDHEPAERVTMAWAGVNSENLASIWLLYHLADRLNGEQVRVLAHSLDLARRPGEALADYRTRIQKAGVLPTRSRVEEGLFLQARAEVRSGLALSGHPEDELALVSLLYGWGVSRERSRADEDWKLAALENSWVWLGPRAPVCAAEHRRLALALEEGRLPLPTSIPDLGVMVDGDRVEVACGRLPEGYAAPDDTLLALLAPLPDAEVEEDAPTRRGLLGRLVSRAEARREAGRPELAPEDDLLVDGRLHLSTLRELEASVERRRLARRAAGADAPDLYDPEVLYWHQDFRVLLGLRYVEELAARYGVRSEIQHVLSLPLGASEITLEEAATLYTGLTTGQSWAFPGTTGGLAGRELESPPAPALLIAEIRDVDGKLLYRAEPEPTQVSPPPVAEMSADILRNVVRWGTGRRASSAVLAGGLPVPLGGKTGTTNDFRNAAFLGFVPGVHRGAYRAAEGYAVGVYVGYDDNRPLVAGRIRLAGSSGALPAWIGIARGLEEAELLGEPSERTEADLAWPLAWSRELRRIAVDGSAGLPLEEAPEEIDPAQPSVLVLRRPGRAGPEPAVAFEHADRPVRIAPRTDDASRRAAERERARRERALRRPSVWDAP